MRTFLIICFIITFLIAAIPFNREIRNGRLGIKINKESLYASILVLLTALYFTIMLLLKP